jgi:hypothetical protein
MIWSEQLTDAQLRMVVASGDDDGSSGYGVPLRGAAWATARALVAKGIGWIEGGRPNGSDLEGLYFNNGEGVEIVHEFDEACGECGKVDEVNDLGLCVACDCEANGPFGVGT